MTARPKFLARLQWVLIAVLFALAALPQFAAAHEVRPAYLQIDQVGPDRYRVLWRTPLFSGVRLPVVLRFPDDVRNVTPPVERQLPDSIVERRVIEVQGGLAGRRVEMVGLQATITDALVRIETQDGSRSTTLVRPSQPWVDIPATQSAFAIAVTYLEQGIEHILFGFDHLLFVAALMLIVRNWRVLVSTITAFTVAHSITLTSATLGWVSVPAPPLEAMIAVSILLVATEIVRMERGQSSVTIRWPWIVAFAFGLLHGFGFAGALADLGLPQGDIPLTLLSFNVGVEIGQLTFIAAMLAVVHVARRVVAIPRQAIVAAAYGIGGIAAF